MKNTNKNVLNNKGLTEEEKQIILSKIEESKKLDKFLATTKINTAAYCPAKKRGKNGK